MEKRRVQSPVLSIEREGYNNDRTMLNNVPLFVGEHSQGDMQNSCRRLSLQWMICIQPDRQEPCTASKI